MNFPDKLLEGLPQNIVLGGSIQYLDYLSKLKQFLESNGKKVYMFNSRHGQYPGQILGCDIFKFKPADEITGKEAEFDACLRMKKMSIFITLCLRWWRYWIKNC